MTQGPIQQGARPVEPYPNSPPRPNKQQDGSYRDSPPPPPPTSTHPLYGTHGQPPRYTASMGEPPRGGYYPASGSQPPRPYQFQGTNPWEREEREKVGSQIFSSQSSNYECFSHFILSLWLH